MCNSQADVHVCVFEARSNFCFASIHVRFRINARLLPFKRFEVLPLASFTIACYAWLVHWLTAYHTMHLSFSLARKKYGRKIKGEISRGDKREK